MADMVLSTTLPLSYDEAVARVREGIADVGFGVLTEIDVAATMKKKLDRDIAPKIILGACRPELAYQALTADPRVAALMPCNVVVSEVDGGSLVEVMNPEIMPEFTGTAELAPMATEATKLMKRMLAKLSESTQN